MTATGNKSEDRIGGRILEVATEHFVAKGLHGVTTAGIAAAAKTSKRELYDRFPSKEALFAGVINRLCELGGEAGPQALEDDASLEAQLSYYCFAAARRFAIPETHAVLASTAAAQSSYAHLLDEFWRLGPGQAAAAMQNVLKQAAKSGEIDISSPKRDARWLIMQSCGPFVLEMFFVHDRTPSNARIQSHVDAVVSAYLGRATG